MFNPNLIRIIALQCILRGYVKCYCSKAFNVMPYMETNRALWIRDICKRLFKCANEEIFLEATDLTLLSHRVGCTMTPLSRDLCTPARKV